MLARQATLLRTVHEASDAHFAAKEDGKDLEIKSREWQKELQNFASQLGEITKRRHHHANDRVMALIEYYQLKGNHLAEEQAYNNKE